MIGPPPPPYSPPAEGHRRPGRGQDAGAEPLGQPGDRGAPVPPRRGEARRLPALRPRAQLPARGGRHRGAALSPRGRQAGRCRRAGRRDRAQDPPADRPVVQVRHDRPHAGPLRGAAHGQGRARRSTTAPSRWSARPARPRCWRSPPATATWPTRSRRRWWRSAPTSPS